MSEEFLIQELNQERTNLHALQEELARTNSEVMQLTLELEEKINVQTALAAENRHIRNLLEAIFEADPAGLAVVIEPELKFVYTNPAYRFIASGEGQSLDGQTYFQVWHPVGQDSYSESIQEVLLTGRPFQTLDFERRFPDGTIRNFTFQVRRIDWDLGQPAALIAMWDTTERKLNELRLKNSEARYRELAESLTDPFTAWDASLRCIYRNKAAAVSTMVPDEQALYKTFAELYPSLVGTEVHQAYLQTLGTHRSRTLEVEWVRPSDGRRLYIEASLYPTQDGLTVLSRDITAKKAADQAMEVQRRLLEQREQERMQIARDLHDGPVQELTGAYYALDGILFTSEDEGLAQGLRAIRDVLRSQVAELRNYAGELRPPALSKFGLARGIRAHLDTFKEKHPELSINYIEEVQEGDQFPEHKRIAVYRIYQEALNNIVKHARASEVMVHLEKADHCIRLEIRDNGRGFNIPGDWLELIRQGHLGLAGMRERAEAAGGYLEIESHSEDGKSGTLLRVQIPE